MFMFHDINNTQCPIDFNHFYIPVTYMIVYWPIMADIAANSTFHRMYKHLWVLLFKKQKGIETLDCSLDSWLMVRWCLKTLPLLSSGSN